MSRFHDRRKPARPALRLTAGGLEYLDTKPADGTAPTNSTGQVLFPGDVLALDGDDYQDFMKKFQIINDTNGSNGVIDGAFLKGNTRS